MNFGGETGRGQRRRRTQFLYVGAGAKASPGSIDHDSVNAGVRSGALQLLK
jgi:hypothetical protein